VLTNLANNARDAMPTGGALILPAEAVSVPEAVQAAAGLAEASSSDATLLAVENNADVRAEQATHPITRPTISAGRLLQSTGRPRSGGKPDRLSSLADAARQLSHAMGGMPPGRRAT
jgi:hypothetical protein